MPTLPLQKLKKWQNRRVFAYILLQVFEKMGKSKFFTNLEGKYMSNLQGEFQYGEQGQPLEQGQLEEQAKS